MNVKAYDPALRQFTDDEVHPVDQAVVLAVTVPLGAIASAPDTGIDIVAIKNAPRAALQTVITDAVRRALAKRIADGDIDFRGAPLRPDAAGRPFFFVDYVNLRLPAQPTRRQTFPLPR